MCNLSQISHVFYTGSIFTLQKIRAFVVNYAASSHKNSGDWIDVPCQINRLDSFQSTQSSLNHRSISLLIRRGFFDPKYSKPAECTNVVLLPVTLKRI